MLVLFLKAKLPGGADLFAMPVQVNGYTTQEGTYVAPHTAVRHKRATPAAKVPSPAPDLFSVGQAAPQPSPEVEPERQPDPPKVMLFSVEEPAGPELSDDPSSPNYRYRDTGYVAGSRKEMAAAVIRGSAREGRQVLATQIDWDELEQNPREAKELITKSNLFGQVDWAALRAEGMDPGAGFLVDRVYAAIGTAPAEDSPIARQDYTLGLQTLRERLEACRTVDQVVGAVDDIAKEYDGRMLTAEETARHQALSAEARDAWKFERSFDDLLKPLYDASQAARAAVYPLEREVENRKARKWAPKPDLEEKLAEARKRATALWDEWGDKATAQRPLLEAARKRREDLGRQINELLVLAKLRNMAENPLHRAWRTLGERFIAVARYRSSKGSDAFAKHVTAAKAGKVKDWAWAEQETARAPRTTKESVRFQLAIPDEFKRVGGRPVDVESTLAMKERFNLRDVQSGNWVLRDTTAAQWHTQQAAAALADLADVLGVDDGRLAFNGRLAIAFGARGTGNSGFGGGARAHYEPVHRIINITKMKGGGSLGHEWLHALDNLLAEIETGKSAATDSFVTETPEALPPGPLQDAFINLRSAMFDGVERASETLAYTAHDVRAAAANLDRTYLNAIARKIKAAPDVHAAVQAVDEHFAPKDGQKQARKQKQLNRDWRTIAVAHHGANPAGGTLEVKSGPSISSYAMESARLDNGGTTYWSQGKEMAARAFQSYVEDKLASMGRRNDYLSAYADNRYHDGKPYPAGAERIRMNEAFDRLFAVMREANSLAKALAALDALWSAGAVPTAS